MLTEIYISSFGDMRNYMINEVLSQKMSLKENDNNKWKKRQRSFQGEI